MECLFMDKSTNSYTVIGLMLTTIGTIMITQKLGFYLDIIVCSVGFGFSVIGYYKTKA